MVSGRHDIVAVTEISHLIHKQKERGRERERERTDLVWVQQGHTCANPSQIVAPIEDQTFKYMSIYELGGHSDHHFNHSCFERKQFQYLRIGRS